MTDERDRFRYGFLLRLYPPSFRRARGAELRQTYRDMERDWVERRGRGRMLFRILLTWDAVRHAAAAWAGVARSRNGHGTGGDVMGTVLQDLRFGMRQLVRRPAFSLTIVALVALGIAGNTAVFRIVDGLFLSPLPLPEADRLVDVDVTAPQWDLDFVSVSIGDYQAWEQEASSFDALAVYFQGGGNLALDGGAQRVNYIAASHTLGDALGIAPLSGRFFDASEDTPDGPRVGLLSRAFWEDAFGADPTVLGRTLRLNGETVEIIGVLPREATFLGDAELWIPLQEDDESSFYLSGIGRLKEGVTAAGAQEELQAIHLGRAEERPMNRITSPVVASLRDRYLGPQRLPSMLLFGAVGIVLLIACANVAGLMFVRSLSRAREVAVRAALGATRGRLAMQLLSESALLALAGGAAGTLLGIRLSGFLLSVLQEQLPPFVRFDLDPGFVLFTVLLTGGTAVAFGILPSMGMARRGTEALARGTATSRTRRILGGVVAGQVGLAALLLVVAGLVTVDARDLARADIGFDSEGLLTWRLQLPEPQYPEAEDRRAFQAAYLDRLAALPEVEDAALASILPLMGHSGWFFEVEGTEEPAQGTHDAPDSPVVLRRWVSGGYIEAMGVSLALGRGLQPEDNREDAPPVAVVNETFVRTHLGGDPDPVGRRIRVGGNSSPWITIVGVARDVRHYGVDTPMRPAVYEPLGGNPGSFVQVALRGATGMAPSLESARRITQEMDPELALYDVQTMEARQNDALLTRRAVAWLFGGFSLVALLLATAGLYGVISYGVGQRTREIGIRLAMGAKTAQVGGAVVREGMALAGTGIAVGLGVAAALAGVVSGVLVSTPSNDLGVFAAVGLGLVAITALANWIPARRAARVSPMATLRDET